MISSEFSKLVLPFVPELRKSVEEQYQFSLACYYIVQAYVVDISIFVFEHIFSWRHDVFLNPASYGNQYQSEWVLLLPLPVPLDKDRTSPKEVLHTTSLVAHTGFALKRLLALNH